MKIRVNEDDCFGVVAGEVYEAALVATAPKGYRYTVASMFGQHPEDPYRDAEGEYWVFDDPRLNKKAVCVGPDVEVVE